jgi:hypothetical protein
VGVSLVRFRWPQRVGSVSDYAQYQRVPRPTVVTNYSLGDYLVKPVTPVAIFISGGAVNRPSSFNFFINFLTASVLT